ncbi:MAG: hypothetical protein ACXADY_19215 [Candidatus Hodarchaeales archaeon]|jgi:hypothetical protein
MYLYAGIALLSLIPFIWLFRSYQRTEIIDFLIFAGLFLSVFVNNFAYANLISDYPIGILEYAAVISYLFIWLLLFLHVFRVKWEKSPTILWYSTLLIFIVQILIYFVIVVSGYSPIILSRSYYLFIKSNKPLLLVVFSISHLFRVVALLVAIFIYLTVEHIIVDKRVTRARNFWIITAIIFLIPPISTLGVWWNIWVGNPLIAIISNITNFAIIFVAYIVIRYPESVLISKVQVVRALDLYKTVQSTTSNDELKEFGMPTLVNYIKKIPPELLAS